MKEVVDRVQKITSIMASLANSDEANTDKSAKGLELAEKLSNEVDQIIYKIYGLTPDEISIVENDFPYWPFTSF
ncbi:MAG: hypothetical protein ACP5UO_05500 [Thermoplasmata archaeon]